MLVAITRGVNAALAAFKKDVCGGGVSAGVSGDVGGGRSGDGTSVSGGVIGGVSGEVVAFSSCGGVGGEGGGAGEGREVEGLGRVAVNLNTNLNPNLNFNLDKSFRLVPEHVERKALAEEKRRRIEKEKGGAARIKEERIT
jgi:hypothetical protein